MRKDIFDKIIEKGKTYLLLFYINELEGNLGWINSILEAEDFKIYPEEYLKEIKETISYSTKEAENIAKI
jgi:hypothetical protein